MSSSLFFSSATHVLFVLLEWFVRQKVGGHTATVLFLLLLSGFVQDCTYHSSVVATKNFLCAFFCVSVVHSYCNIDTATVWKKSQFILSNRFDFNMIDILTIAVQDFSWYILTSLSVDVMLPHWHVYWSINFRGLAC